MDAIIFDCDGTLADTMPPHFEAWSETLPSYGLSLGEQRFYDLGGWPTRRIVELLATENGLTLDVDHITEEKEAAFERRIASVRPIERVTAVVREYHGRIPLAVATGGMRRICEQILHHIGMTHKFGAVVCCEDVARHKPAPDIYLEAARRLGVDPTKCLVYEDTEPGLEAGRQAGMQVIDVRTMPN